MNWQKLKDNDKFTVRITITNRDTGESLITQEKTFNYDRNAAADKVEEAIWNKYTNLLLSITISLIVSAHATIKLSIPSR